MPLKALFLVYLTTVHAIVARHSYDSRETFVRVSHEVLTNVAFHFHLWDLRLLET